MSFRSIDYAFLSDDAYNNRKPGKTVSVGGIKYRILATANDQSGYQATAYQRVDTNEVVIANRGTEFFKEPYSDVVKADGGMVKSGLNSQLDDAMVFANHVRGLVRDLERRVHHPIEITVTGHSLGGTLAEIESYRFGFHGETFNAYGAAGLAYGIPEGGNRIINHMVATDAVSAASEHFGEVRIYASAQNIADMEEAGYGLSPFPRSDANPLLAAGVRAHLMKNFLPGNDFTGQSILDPINAARYRAHHVGIDQLRATIMEDRKVLSGEWALQGHMTPEEVANRKIRIESQLDAAVKRDAADGAAQGAFHAIQDALHEVASTREMLGEIQANAAKYLEEQRPIASFALEPVATSKKPPALSQQLDDPTHPDHAMYLQAREGVHKLDAECGRASDYRSDQLAAALVVAARRAGLTQIEAVVLHRDTENVSALQSTPASSDYVKELLRPTHVDVPTVQSLNTPMEQSGQQWEQVMQQKQSHERQLSQQQETLKQAGHGFAR